MVNRFLVGMYTDLASSLISFEWCHSTLQLLGSISVRWYVDPQMSHSDFICVSPWFLILPPYQYLAVNLIKEVYDKSWIIVGHFLKFFVKYGFQD